MTILVSDSSRIPDELMTRNDVEHWTFNEFIDRANGDGLDIPDNGIYFNVDKLSLEIYNALLSYKDFTTITYFLIEGTGERPYFVKPEEMITISAEPPAPKVESEPKPASTQPEAPEAPAVQDTSAQQVQTPTENPLTGQQNIGQPVTQPQVDPYAQQVQQTPQQSPPQYDPNYGQPTPQQPPYQQTQPQPGYTGQLYGEQPQPGYTGQLYGQQGMENSQQTMGNGSGQLYGQQNPNQNINVKDGVKLVQGDANATVPNSVRKQDLGILLNYDPNENNNNQTRNRKAAKVILFGSSKGGTGKTFTCLASAYWFAKQHPNLRIALADFDIIDGQIGITLNKLSPTLQDFYKVAKAGNNDIDHLRNCKVMSDNFSPNIEFYLAPSQDIDELTNDTAYWTDVFKLLITNYDVVFFDSGIDYLGKKPISQLYKIADKIIITCNTSINSVKSVIKQFKTLSGHRVNNEFDASMNILDRVNIVLTRAGDNKDINDLVVYNLTKYADVIAAFGNIDDIISKVQWYQDWEQLDAQPGITDYLTEITKLDGID